MQSDVTLVGGTTPAAHLPAPPTAQAMTKQAGDIPPTILAPGQSMPRASNISQTAAVTAAKIALSVDGSPTALSQADRVLKPYGVTMLPEPPIVAEQNGPAQDVPDHNMIDSA